MYRHARWSRRVGCVRRQRSRAVPAGTLEPDKFLFEKGNEALEARSGSPPASTSSRSPKPTRRARIGPTPSWAIGDTYLGEGSGEALVLAINEFQEFLSFYPTNHRADYAQYKLGMAHFRQMRRRSAIRPKRATRIRELRDVRRPISEQRADAGGQGQAPREARDRLSEADYVVGFFYYRQRWYPGAIDRLQAVLKDDPEFTGRDGVYFYLANRPEDQARGRGAALLRAAGGRIRAERAPGRSAQADRGNQSRRQCSAKRACLAGLPVGVLLGRRPRKRPTAG